MSRRRIAVVTDAIAPFHRGGKELRYREVTRRLVKYADVDVYTMRWWDGPAECNTDGLRLRAISACRPLYAGQRRSLVQAVLFAVGCLRLLFRRYDVVEADHMPYLPLYVLRLVTWVRRKPLVATWHEVWGPAYWRSYLGAPGRVGWAIERIAMRLPDRIIAASHATAERLRTYVGDRVEVTVAPNGIDLPLARQVQPRDEWSNDVVTVGRLLPHKRIDLLLDAVADLAHSGRAVTCRIVGDGPARADLVAQARRVGVDHLVIFDPSVDSQADLFAVLRSCRVFALPSEREGFGIAALEAMACGLPVVTTSAANNLARPLIARDARSLVCPPASPAFAEALWQVLTTTETVAKEPAWLRDYDWDRVTSQVAAACLR